jgi:hypothetical protein
VIRSLAISLGILLSASNTGLAADCTTIWRKMDAEYSAELAQNLGKPNDPTVEYRTNSQLQLSTPTTIYLLDPKAPQSMVFMDTLDQVAAEIPLRFKLVARPEKATIGVGVVDDTGIGSEDFHITLESFETDATKRSKFLASLASGNQIQYTEEWKVYRGSEDKPLPPARRFIALGTASISNIRAIALSSIIGAQYLKYVQACEGYQGVFWFNTGFDKVQPDDLALIRHALSVDREQLTKIER